MVDEIPPAELPVANDHAGLRISIRWRKRSQFGMSGKPASRPKVAQSTTRQLRRTVVHTLASGLIVTLCGKAGSFWTASSIPSGRLR